MKTDFLTKDYQIKLPPSSWKEWGKISLLILLPNLFFVALAMLTGTSRPLLNLDYLLIMWLLILPYRFSRIAGGVALFFLVLIDFLMFTIQIFPFLDLAVIRYLMPFVLLAPPRYLIFLVAMVFYIGLIIWASYKVSSWQHGRVLYPTVAFIVLTFFSYQLIDLKYDRFAGGILGRNNYYYGHSQAYLYHESTQSKFALSMNATPTLTPYPSDKEFAAVQLNKPFSNKILYIVAESWGVARTQQAQRLMLQKIYDQQANFEWIREGFFDFSGATIEGELRELCQVKINNGYALSRLSEKDFATCIPAQLKKQGYKTVALHGTSGRLYDRYSWYEKAGFQQSIFGEHLPNLTRCIAFNGVCDSELVPVVADYFRQHQNDKIFYYWLTLTSHAPYPKDDIRDEKRFDCTLFGMKPNGDICRNAQLETQFFDNLAQLIERPEMKGVEVIVVGDHMPPLFGGEDIYPYLRWNDVSWLHFKVKE